VYDDYNLFTINIPQQKKAYELTPTAKINQTYEMREQQRVLSDSHPALPQRPLAPVKSEASACIWAAEKYHSLPLQVLEGIGTSKIISDSFLLHNYCNDSIPIVEVVTDHPGLFSISRTLVPKQNTFLKFNGSVTHTGASFTAKSYICYLVFANRTTLSFTIEFTLVGNNCRILYNTDGTVAGAIEPSVKTRYTKAILAKPDGRFRASGSIQDGDTTLKVGNWQYAENENGVLTERVYSKAISMYIMNQLKVDNSMDFDINVLENGSWKKHLIEDAGGGRLIYITEATDSILAFSKGLEYRFAVAYDELPHHSTKLFYLLQPGERSLKIGYYATAFSTVANQYALIPDYSILTGRTKSTPQLIDSIIGSLQDQYPTLGKVVVSKNMRAISLQGLTAKEQHLLMKQLKQNKGIAYVCQLFSITDRQVVTYCKNNVYVELDGNNTAGLQDAALQLGFSNMQADVGSNRYWFTYKSKLLDESFFEAFKKLTECPLVKSVFFNHYVEAEIDYGLKPKARS
jgi:hypothetical protein